MWPHSHESFKCTLEELEQLKSERDNLAIELARYIKNLKNTVLALG